MLHKHPSSEEEARFHRAVFDVLNNHSLLGHNLGLCISFLKSPKNPEAMYSWLQGKPESLYSPAYYQGPGASLVYLNRQNNLLYELVNSDH